MILNPFDWPTQRAFGTKVPSAMAKSGGREDTIVLLERKDSAAKLAGQTSRTIAEEFNPRRPFKGLKTYETQDNHTRSPDGPDVG
jgi:hypothetical protein